MRNFFKNKKFFYLQRRRFSDDLSLERLRKNGTGRAPMVRVTPMHLSTIEDNSPSVAPVGAPRFDFRQSMDDTEKDEKYLKMKMTKKYLSTVYALCYCIFIIVFSMLIFIGDAIVGLNPVPEVKFFFDEILEFFFKVLIFSSIASRYSSLGSFI